MTILSKTVQLLSLLPLLATTAWGGEILHVDGYIGSEPVRFIVDTGSSEVVIPEKLATHLGIPFQQGELARYETAGGPMTGHRIVLESVKVGNVEALGVVALVPAQENGLQEVLLGMSFLKNISMTVSGGTVSFSP
jgi:aspartyl protease family protein